MQQHGGRNRHVAPPIQPDAVVHPVPPPASAELEQHAAPALAPAEPSSEPLRP